MLICDFIIILLTILKKKYEKKRKRKYSLIFEIFSLFFPSPNIK